MSDFEFLFALFGLLFGLIVAEVSLKFADAIKSSDDRPMGILTPALAFLVLTDLTNFWLFLWGSRGVLEGISLRSIMASRSPVNFLSTRLRKFSGNASW